MLKSIALKSFMGYTICKNQLLGTEGAKIAIGPQKRVPRGPKSENQLYLDNYDSTRSKNWQMLRTSWYNCLKKVSWALDFVKIGYWAPKGHTHTYTKHTRNYERKTEYCTAKLPYNTQ